MHYLNIKHWLHWCWGHCWSHYNIFRNFQAKSTPSSAYSICLCTCDSDWDTHFRLPQNSCCVRKVSDRTKHRTLAIPIYFEWIYTLILINIVYLTPFLDFNSASILFLLSFSSCGIAVNWKPNRIQVSWTAHKWFFFLRLVFFLLRFEIGIRWQRAFQNQWLCAQCAPHQNQFRWIRIKCEFMIMVFMRAFHVSSQYSLFHCCEITFHILSFR